MSVKSPARGFFIVTPKPPPMEVVIVKSGLSPKSAHTAY
ncbi:rfbP protein [Shewanella algae]|nr:rfbP protein [Shewanella algae]